MGRIPTTRRSSERRSRCGSVVGSRGRGLARCPVGSPWLYPPFPASCPCRFAVSPSPAPATSNGANGFPVRRFPVRFTPRVMRPIGQGALSGAGPVSDVVLVEQPQRLVKPHRTPPRPAEARPFPRPHQMTPHLFLHPLRHVGKAPARVPDPKVLPPLPQNRIDLGDHPRLFASFGRRSSLPNSSRSRRSTAFSNRSTRRPGRRQPGADSERANSLDFQRKVGRVLRATHYGSG